MPICINGYELTDAEIEQELPQHQDAPNPLHQATTALILRHVLLDEARRQSYDDADEEGCIDALLQAQIATIEAPSDVDCRQHYEQHPQHFEIGSSIEIDHILFQVTEQVDLQRLRERAQHTLDELLQHPERFAEQARVLSNCPSGQDGGQLGQIVRGATVPEFERVIFAMEAHSLWPQLVESRFGLHIVHSRTRHAGRLLSYEQAAPAITRALHQARCDQAWRNYLQKLVRAAEISGIELPRLEQAEIPD